MHNRWWLSVSKVCPLPIALVSQVEENALLEVIAAIGVVAGARTFWTTGTGNPNNTLVMACNSTRENRIFSTRFPSSLALGA